MNRLLALTGTAAAVGTAAILGGLGVALAHDDHPHGQQMMDTALMQMRMDPVTMQQHMKDVLGEAAYSQMESAMKTSLGNDGYERMLDRMATACSREGMGMPSEGSSTAPSAPGHSAHHPSTPAAAE